MQKSLPLTVATVLFMLGSTLSVVAQQTTSRSGSTALKSNGNNTANETIYNAKKVESVQLRPAVQPVSNNASTPSAAKSKVVSKPTALPYENYKGITNLDLAKQEWVKDHPAEYQKAVNASGTVQPAKVKASINNDPNQGRRLPKNYDDSKTNIQSK